MKITNNNIKKFLESDNSYEIFDIEYAEKEKESIKKFNISKNKNYADTNTDKLTDFFKDIGDNKDEDIQNIINIIHKFIDILLNAYDVDAYWLIIRISLENSFYDIPRWHCDGYYFSDKINYQTKFVTTLKGPTTLVLDTNKKEKEHFYNLQDYKNKIILNTELNLAHRKNLSENIKGKKIELNNNQGIIFVAGDKEKCLIHSEPKHSTERIFISILPGTKKKY
jgi:hypothetical protein